MLVYHMRGNGGKLFVLNKIKNNKKLKIKIYFLALSVICILQDVTIHSAINIVVPDNIYKSNKVLNILDILILNKHIYNN